MSSGLLFVETPASARRFGTGSALRKEPHVVFQDVRGARDDEGYSRVALTSLENGEDFTVTRHGKRFKESDFNFWGVTFAKQSGRFYATLGTGGKTYLLEGDFGTRRARVLDESVECPSISPDNTRVAYKKRTSDGRRLHVLDLETLVETPLAERRSIDDQVEWLDDERILYGLSQDTWVVPADGDGVPRKFISRGLSPAVVRD